MELWIRSQDKEVLVKANALYVMDNQIWNEVPFYENHKKIGLTITGHNHRLAQYKSKERALEVLDEIQNLLKPQIKLITHAIEQRELKDFSREMIIQPSLNELQFQEVNTWVYQMPEK